MEDEIMPEIGTSVPLFLNPLDLDIVLIHVIDYLPTKDVAKCRLVCKRWEVLSTKIMLKRRDHIVTLTCQNAAEFTLLMESSRCNPFPGVKWTCWSLTSSVFINLMATCRNRGGIKVLVMDMDCASGFTSIVDEAYHCGSGRRIDDDKNGLNFLTNVLQNLSHSLQVLDFDEISPKFAHPPPPPSSNIVSQEIPTTSLLPTFKAPFLQKIIFPCQEESFCEKFWASVFRVAPNLQEIHTNHANQTVPIFASLQSWGRFDQLSKLRLEEIGQAQVDTILGSSIVLEEFKVNVISNNVGRKKLELLLKKLSGTLLVLALGSPEDNSKIRITLPKMLKLIELGLYHCDDSLIVLEGVKFHRDTPKLKILSVSSAYKKLDWREYFSCNDDGGENSQPPIPLLSVESLTLAILVRDPNCCLYLGQLFPNVKKLMIEFPRPEFLCKIWTTWQNLIELYIYFNVGSTSVMDIGLCGFPPTWKADMDGKLKPKGMSELGRNQFLQEAEPPVIHAGVSNLKRLQRLTVESNPLRDASKSPLLTDLSVYFSLVELKDLRVLKIGRSQISPTAVRYLKGHLAMISTIDIRGIEGPGVFSKEESEELVEYIRYYNHEGNFDEDAV